MAKDYLLVDGYNIIHAWKELKEIAEDNLENARTRLIDILSNYQGYKKNEIILVFDAHKLKGNTRNVIHYHNIDVVYTKEAETADQFIEKIANEMGRQYNIRVATSDALEQVIILSKGATRISARELEAEINEANKNIRAKYINKPRVGTNSLVSNLPPEMAELIERLRRE